MLGHFIQLYSKKTYEISQITLLEVVIITGLVFLVPIYLLEMNFGNKIVLGKPFILTLSYVVIFPGLASFFLDQRDWNYWRQ